MRGRAIKSVFVLAAFVYAAPYNTPSVDGTINIAPDDWDADELLVDDPLGDSYWGSNNDIDDVFLTWDAQYLYLGIRFTVSDNGMVLYVESGLPGGVTDFSSARGYRGAFPRNIRFPSDCGIDLMIGSWNGEGPYVYLLADSSSTDVTSSCIVATGGGFEQEVAVPWELIYSSASGVVQAGAELRVVCVIVGGDDYGGCDAAPDNSSIDGGAGPHDINQLASVLVDADGDGIPDYEGEALSGYITFDDTLFAEPPYPQALVEVFSEASGELVASARSSSEDGSYFLAGLVAGQIYDVVASANGFAPDTAAGFVASEGVNELDFVLEPYGGSIYGVVSPSDFPTVVYARQGTTVVGFGDTTEAGSGEYEITHLPPGFFEVVAQPQSSDYLPQVVESVWVGLDSATRVDIALERAGVVREVTDATGDDYGPGWYQYPTDRVFVDGAFDIEFVKIRDLGESYQFEIGVGDIPGPSVVDWNPYYPPLNLQKIDIYIDCHRGGSRVGLPNRNVTFAATDAWDFAISADGWWVGLLASNGQDIFSNYTQNTSDVTVDADTATDRMWITVSKDALVDHMGLADTSKFDQWDFIVLMLGHDFSGVEGVRWVNSGTSNQWEFNNGADGDVDPNVIDLVVMPGLDASGQPKEPGRSQEEMLDYTIQSPVVLEAARSYDITPPTIEYEPPSELLYLSGSGGVYIEVSVDDDVAVADVRLYWRNIGDAEWHAVDMGYRERVDRFVGDIPFEQLKPDSFEMFFEAFDSAGNVAYFPQDYPDTATPCEPTYPLSTCSPDPTRVLPAVEEIDSFAERIAINTFVGEKDIKFPDGTILVFDRSAVFPDVDTIIISFAAGDAPDELGAPQAFLPELTPLGIYRRLRVSSEKGDQVFEQRATISLHYCDWSTSLGDGEPVLCVWRAGVPRWISLGGSNDAQSNSMEAMYDANGTVFLGVFYDSTLKPLDEPISNIIITPNPFSPNGDGLYDETNITFDLAYDGRLDADIFDMHGRLIKVLARNLQVSEGRNINLVWDGRGADGRTQPMGIYMLSVRFTYIFEGNERIDRRNEAIVVVR